MTRFLVKGTDAYGRPIAESVDIDTTPPTYRQRVKWWLMKRTPLWAWNALWYKTGLSKARYVKRITAE
jgi:hypothetical protein